MFAMVVLFGLIHGLVLLPICLSLVGPLPSVDEEDEKKKGDVELTGIGNNGHLRMGNGTALSRKSEEKGEGDDEASKPLNGDAVHADSATA